MTGNGGITDRGMAHVAEMGRLERLYLADTKITDKGLDMLRPLEGLTRLNVTGTKVTSAAAETFEKEMPNLRAVRRSDRASCDIARVPHPRPLPVSGRGRGWVFGCAAKPSHHSSENQRSSLCVPSPACSCSSFPWRPSRTRPHRPDRAPVAGRGAQDVQRAAGLRGAARRHRAATSRSRSRSPSTPRAGSGSPPRTTTRSPAEAGKGTDKLFVLSDFGPDGKAKKVQVVRRRPEHPHRHPAAARLQVVHRLQRRRAS